MPTLPSALWRRCLAAHFGPLSLSWGKCVRVAVVECLPPAICTPGQSLTVLSRAVLPPGVIKFLKNCEPWQRTLKTDFPTVGKYGTYQRDKRHPVCVVDRGRAGMCVRGVRVRRHVFCMCSNSLFYLPQCVVCARLLVSLGGAERERSLANSRESACAFLSVPLIQGLKVCWFVLPTHSCFLSG